ncbi:hypothetical protein SARC_03493 [Sphaeroforma arctica JP610]|uniref:FAD/NAD(P)-binding domain-containing protein n=1 Tax=Sphaeroforma arctica JP610 TaxID=667725 RepID=A0A0L0G5H6_9EUKA|nr:hypothetical protein SARC_03493 [Sphaeroforma arctica JP610]KNC84292.1 hypothetical protein SARC_03493 [Sphaeroforma arctica JP610]|eukprot:XP_014158194.1 hypothetical protein SARC_03493 [Sphaeroforma arctica JP610]
MAVQQDAVVTNTVVIGGGHAGISMSVVLKARGIQHVVLEKARTLEQWRSNRWDSFKLNTTVDYSLIYGQKPDPENGFSGKQESLKPAKMLGFWEAYIQETGVKVREHTEVVSVDDGDNESVRYVVSVESQDGGPTTYHARNVIACSGTYQKPRIPEELATKIPAHIKQVRVGTYKNIDDSLNDGGVLVVGGGQTGFQIGEEIVRSGRKVVVCTSMVPGSLRSYRGEDIFYWMDRIGFLSMPIQALSVPEMRFNRIPVTGNDHAISPHSMAREGAILVGSLEKVEGDELQFKDNLKEHVRFCDESYSTLAPRIEGYLEKTGTAGEYPPPEKEPEWEPHEPLLNDSPILKMNMNDEGITNVFWATGWGADFSFLKCGNLVDEMGPAGRPLTCDASKPGFFYLGFPWLRTLNSANIQGHHADALYIADQLTE